MQLYCHHMGCGRTNHSLTAKGMDHVLQNVCSIPGTIIGYLYLLFIFISYIVLFHLNAGKTDMKIVYISSDD